MQFLIQDHNLDLFLDSGLLSKLESVTTEFEINLGALVYLLYLYISLIDMYLYY